jgi:hypothetical protein
MSVKNKPKLKLITHSFCGWYCIWHEKDEEGFVHITYVSPLSTLEIHSSKHVNRRQLENRFKLAEAYFESEYAEYAKVNPLPTT